MGQNVSAAASLATRRAMRGLIRAQPLPEVEGKHPPRRVGRSQRGTAATKDQVLIADFRLIPPGGTD